MFHQRCDLNEHRMRRVKMNRLDTKWMQNRIFYFSALFSFFIFNPGLECEYKAKLNKYWSFVRNGEFACIDEIRLWSGCVVNKFGKNCSDKRNKKGEKMITYSIGMCFLFVFDTAYVDTHSIYLHKDNLDNCM